MTLNAIDRVSMRRFMTIMLFCPNIMLNGVEVISTSAREPVRT